MQDRVCFEGFKEYIAPDIKAKLQEKFIVPPFSILDARQGYWQERKRQWVSLGIQSELGRGEGLTYSGEQINSENLNYYRNRGKCAPGHSLRPACDYSKGERGDGKGRPIPVAYTMDKRDKKWQKSHNSLGNITERIATGETVTETTLKIAGAGIGTSIFDPVLCELVYRWFCPTDGLILDPFAGGSVRGIVASILGYDYHGIDLSAPQLKANIAQAEQIMPSKQPQWYVGDSKDMDSILPSGAKFDLIFSCPPYHDLEQYSEDPADLSNMSWDTFKKQYLDIISKAVLQLKNNRFACFVVSEIRSDKGMFKGLVPYTIESFCRSGMWYYNEMILVNVIGSLPVRIGQQFGSYRKIGRVHQNILVFYKGDINLIPKFFKEIDTRFGYGGNNGE